MRFIQEIVSPAEVAAAEAAAGKALAVQEAAAAAQEVEDAAWEQRVLAKRAYFLRTDENACMFPLLSLMSEETRLACLSAVRFRAFTKGQRILRRGEEFNQ